MTNRNIVTPLLIIFTALAVRLTILCLCDGTVLIELGADSRDYLAIAESLREGNGFSLNGQDPTAKRMPLYPLFLAGILSLPGTELRTIQFFQVFIDSFTCLLAYFLARELLNKAAGAVCGLLLALYFPMASRCFFILTETLFTFFLVASVLLIALNRPKIWLSAAAGVVIGIGALVRPNGLVVAICLLLWFPYCYRWEKSLRHLAAFLICVTIVLAPWVIRNAIVMHRFIPTCTISGIALYNAYFIPEKGFGYNEIKKEHYEGYIAIDNEYDKSKYLTRLTLEYIRAYPWQALKLIPVKLSLIVYPYDMKWDHPNIPFRYNIFWGFISTLAVLAVLAHPSYVRERLALLLFPIGALLSTSVVFHGLARYRIPFDPFIAVLAAVGAVWIWRNSRRYLWVGAIVALNAAMLFIGESTFIIALFRDLKPW